MRNHRSSILLRTICPYCGKIHSRATLCVARMPRAPRPNIVLDLDSTVKKNWPSTHSVFSVCLTGLEFIRFFIG